MRSYRTPEPTPAPRRERRRLLRVVALGGLLLASAAGLWAARGLWRENPEPWLGDARGELTALLVEGGDPERRLERARRAEALLRQYLEAEGERPEAARLLLASALLVRGQTAEAEELLGDEVPPQAPTADLERTALIAFRTGHFGLADRLVGEALEREDHREETLRTAIEIRYDLGRDEDVIAHVEELRKLTPDDPRPLLALALVYQDRGAWDHVIDATREFLRVQPNGVGMVRLMLVDALITVGAVGDARREFDLLKAETPELAARSPLLEARLLNLEGRHDEALSRADRILESDPENVEALLLRGRIQLAKGDFTSAVEALEKLTQIDPANFEAHYLLGQAYSRSGETEKARRELHLHQQLLNAQVEIYQLERRAGRNPADVEVRRELADRYREIGLAELAEFWEQAAVSAEPLAGSR